MITTLNNLTLNFLGDSITEGCGTSCREGKRFTALLQARYPLAKINNYGIGGTRIARQSAPSLVPVWDRDFISRVEETDKTADIIGIFGGTNDYGHGDAPLGEMSDRTEYTFYGALHTLILKLIGRFPDKKLFFMTPLHRLGEDNPLGDGNKRVPVASLKTYVNAIREVTEYYSVPVLDLYRISGFQPEVPVLKELYMPDGLHPNDKGHEKLADLIENFIFTL